MAKRLLSLDGENFHSNFNVIAFCPSEHFIVKAVTDVTTNIGTAIRDLHANPADRVQLRELKAAGDSLRAKMTSAALYIRTYFKVNNNFAILFLTKTELEILNHVSMEHHIDMFADVQHIKRICHPKIREAMDNLCPVAELVFDRYKNDNRFYEHVTRSIQNSDRLAYTLLMNNVVCEYNWGNLSDTEKVELLYCMTNHYKLFFSFRPKNDDE